MAQLLVLYATPPDAVAFDKHYTETHIPLVKKIPGLTKFEVSLGPIVTPSGPSPFHLIATLHFDTMATLQSGLASPEGSAASEDAQPLIAPGSHLLLFDNREV